ncbi:MAG TPA: phosphoenolpyruvate synthase [Bdellovibrionota bacterium]|nr:phosphoenolpyruvate synthase [Bdellovibrionota bacterium]
MTNKSENNYIRRFSDLGLNDVSIVGGKNASLGEMIRELTSKGIRIPDGFAITAEAYWHFLKIEGLEPAIRRELGRGDRERGSRIRHLMLGAHLPADLSEQIVAGYHALCQESGADALDVAVRSSATAEDLPQASFAGQQETYLNVQGASSLLESCRRCFASLFTDRALSYREEMGFDHMKVGLSVGVQRMIRSDLASAGVMFSIDTETGFKNAVLINSSYGLGENVVQGSVNPDEYIVFKPTLKEGFRPILQKRLGTKEFKLVYDNGGARMVKNVPVPQDERKKFASSDGEILTLAKWALLIEDHYSHFRGHFTPMDMEWAKDGKTGELFILQARSETVQSRKNLEMLDSFSLKAKGEVLVTGSSIGEKIAQGVIRVIRSTEHLELLKEGEILVTDKTDPDWEPVMKRASAIITNRGGRTCHAAIVARELGIPAIVGTERGTEILKNGMRVTVSCAEGAQGFVYRGSLPFVRKSEQLSNDRRPNTRIMMNVADPGEAFRLSMIPNDGVGLARLEFIIGNTIGVHPMALLRFDELRDTEAKAKIEDLTALYASKPQFFIEKLAEGVGMIGAAFHPKDVIVRLSDFKTNEYAHLLGGTQFEPAEENPMLGFRGASRYYHSRYREGFALECMAIKKVRDDMGLRNIKLMIPFCRTVDEGRRVVEEMKKYGLNRGKNGLEIYVMCEIPSNVLLAESFAEIFDGFSIGSNDLTQLILGVDRDSEVVAPIFDERNQAVQWMIGRVIRVAKSKKKKIGLCGQAPSDYPEFARFLVRCGIDSISLNPDAVVRTTQIVLDQEGEISPDERVA